MDYAQYIGARDGKPFLVNKDGNTSDIISAIVDADKHAAQYTRQLAPVLRGYDDMQTCYNLWQFWKDNVRYKEDPDGYQFVKSPCELYHSGEGDCKSYSIAVASCLKNLGIPYAYRFTTETPGKDFHHVYIVAKPNGQEIIIDCVLNQFNYQNPFVKKKDVAGTSARIGDTQQITDVELSWVKYVEDYKKNISEIRDYVRYQCAMSPYIMFGNNSLKAAFLGPTINKRFDTFVNVAPALTYHFWDESKNGPFPIQLQEKREFGTYIYNKFKDMGLRDGELYSLCSLGVFNLYGIPLEYLFYRAKNMQQYGQPWTPKPGVPYWNTKTGTLIANGANLQDAVKIASCFPHNGGIARPYGQPYWAVGGFIMVNGADPKIAATLGNKPADILNTSTPEAAKEAIQLYNVWRRGQMPGIPIVTVGQGKPHMGGEPPVYDTATGKLKLNIAGTSKIGEPISAIVSAVVAVVTALATIAAVVAKIVKDIKSPNPSSVPDYPRDFQEMYTAANGCTMFMSNGQYKMCCPDGSCQLNPDLNNPANQPAAGANALLGGNTKWLWLGAGALLLLAFVFGGSKKVTRNL